MSDAQSQVQGETVEAKYRLVVQHQLSLEQTCSMEVVTIDPARAAKDALFFIDLFTTQHERARDRAMSDASKRRDLFMQKIGNLQEEQQRLEAVIAELEGRKYVLTDGRKITPRERLAELTGGKAAQDANGDPPG